MGGLGKDNLSRPCMTDKKTPTLAGITIKMREEQGGMAFFSRAEGRTYSLQGIMQPEPQGIQLHAAQN